jgi:DNA-binding IclR family transcriptional regulator
MSKPKADPKHDRYVVPGLKRGLELLLACTRQPAGLGLTDAAQTLGISRSSAFRLLHTLEKLGFVRRGADQRRFYAGLQVMNLRANAVQTDIGAAAGEPMERLRRTTGSSVHLGVRDGTEVLYIHSLSGLRRITTNIGVGTRLPAHATSMGRLLLSAMSEAELRALYRNVKLEAHTDQTVTALTRLADQIRADAARGYVVSEGMFDPAIWSIAAPVHSYSGSIVATISITCPANSFEKEQFRGPMKDQVRAVADEISAFLGYQEPDKPRQRRSG